MQRRMGFGHINLRAKLTLAFALELTVAAAVAAAALLGLRNVKHAFEAAIENGLQVERLADDLKSELAEARSTDRNFLLAFRAAGFTAARDAYLPRYRGHAANMARLIAELEHQPGTGLHGPDRRMREDLVALKPYVNVYAEDFQAAVALMGERTEREPALAPAFAQLQRAIFSQVFDRAILDQLATLLDHMRQRERDHLGRGEGPAADDVRALGAELSGRLARAPDLSPLVRAELQDRLAEYREIFDAVAALEARIAEKRDDFQAAAAVVQPLVTDIAVIGRQYAASQVAAARGAATRTVVAVGTSLAFAVLVGLGFAYALGRYIAVPLRGLTRTAEAIGRGALDVQAPVVASDEIGTLASAFNKMTAQLRELVQSLEDRVHERERAEERVRQLNAELEDRVRQRTAALEAANRELEAFSYSVCHDLRTPLRHIGSFAGLLGQRAPALGAEGQHHLHVISEAVSGMGHLIDSLLAFSQVGRAELHKVDVDLGTLVTEVRAALGSEAEGRDPAGLPVRAIAWHVGALPCVRGDHLLLRQVLINLLSNALKFTRRARVAEIELGEAPGPPQEAVFFVRDNGVGFDMAYAHKLFGVFKRLHRREDFDGVGIGLANVERIVHRHGGRIWAHSAVDHGATFYVSLPRASA
jgi:signal transduction histidine kinase